MFLFCVCAYALLCLPIIFKISEDCQTNRDQKFLKLFLQEKEWRVSSTTFYRLMKGRVKLVSWFKTGHITLWKVNLNHCLYLIYDFFYKSLLLQLDWGRNMEPSVSARRSARKRCCNFCRNYAVCEPYSHSSLSPKSSLSACDNFTAETKTLVTIFYIDYDFVNIKYYAELTIEVCWVTYNVSYS